MFVQKFHEELLNSFKVIERTQNIASNKQRSNYIRNESRVTVLFLCTLSDHALYLYKVS